MISSSEKKNALWNSSSFIVISLLGFINFTLNFNSFNPEIFGLFILINSIFGIGYSLDFGFGVSTVKHVAEASSKSDFKLVNTIFVTFFFVFISIAILIVVFFILYFYLFFEKTDIFSKFDRKLILSVYILLAFGFLFRYMSHYVSKIYEGFSQFVSLSKINISFAVLNTLFIIIIFIFKLDIIYLAFFISFNNFLLFVFLFVFAINRLKNLRFGWSYFNFKLLKRYALYSFNIQAAFFVGSFLDPIIKFLVGGTFGLNFVTFYESAKKIIDLSNGLIFSAQKEVLNKLSEANSMNALKKFVNEKLYIYSKIANYYSVFIYGIVNPLICLFIILWFKNFESMFIFLIFVPAYSLINFGGCLYNVLMVEGKGTKLLIIQLINIGLVSSILFITLKLSDSYIGLLGFYISIIINTFLLLMFIKSIYSLDLKEYLFNSSFTKIILLNVILVAQILMTYIFSDYLYYILITFFVLYIIVFYRLMLFLVKRKNLYEVFKANAT